MNCAKCKTEIAQDAILREAALIYASRRKRRGGGRPATLHKCARCGAEVAGRRLYEAHMQMCPHAPPKAVTDEYLRSIAWEPDDA